MKYVKLIEFITCHKIAFQDDGVNKFACAEIVDSKVCPADFLTAGLGSIHNSPETHVRKTIIIFHSI